MKNNAELQLDVQNAIKWEPLLHAAEIGVIAKDGIVTLTGTVDSYAKKMEAEFATRNTLGVKAIVENIKVQFPNEKVKSDTDIALTVLLAINSNSLIPKGEVKVKVEEGWVTLSGQLPWNFHKELVKNTIAFLTGIKGITNNILIQTTLNDKIEKSSVEKALIRSTIDANDVNVQVSGNVLTLSGTVNSFYEKLEAGRIAWKTPGINNVINELAVDYEYAFS